MGEWEYLKAVIHDYIERHTHAGSALQSCIEGRPNVYRMDPQLRKNLADVLLYICKNVPLEARGSKAKYKAWCGEYEPIPSPWDIDY